MKPIIKYRGGKSKEIKNFLQFIPHDYDRYVEPFAGGAALYFYLEPQLALINDINSKLIDFYLAVRNNNEQLKKELITLESIYHSNQVEYEVLKQSEVVPGFVENKNEALYYLLRDMYNGKIEKKYLDATLYYFINKTSYSGMLRFNSKGEFNVPFGRYKNFDDKIDFRKDWSELYKINGEEIILISYTNISITGTDRPKPQLRVFLDEYKKPFYFAKKHQLRYYLFSIFTKGDEMARGLNNFNPKEYIISIETNLDKEGSRRDLRSIYDYANEKIKGRKFLKCSRSNYKADINQASFIYIGSQEYPEKDIFENFVNMFDSRPYLNSINEEASDIHQIETSENIESLYRPYITAIKSKPFLLLAGISGTGKSRIVRELARACWDEYSDEYKAQKPKNFQMVQVKPNWHDSSDLIGYVSRVSGKAEFVAGDFLKFIAKAWEDIETPYFLCLDEMNLAPVEQYFAEYLSVIESRKSHENGNVTTDPIIYPEYEVERDKNTNELVPKPWYKKLVSELLVDCPTKDAFALNNQFINEGISIPQNLIVVGTVNMDETTFSFSRKVLDRAMTIEMNEVDLHGGLTERNEQIGKLGKAELIGYAVEGVDVYAANKDVCETVLTYLDAVNDVLEGTPFKIAYRTRNEFLLYVVNNLPYSKGENDEELPQGYVVARALDEITSMKVLSRIEGDDTKVSDKFLDSLSKVIEEGLKTVSGEENTVKSISLAKLKEMKDKHVSGYTSFWS